MLSRRVFVKVGAGLMAFVPTTRALAAVPEQANRPGAARPAQQFLEPRYATGVVAAVKPGEVLLRTTYRGDVRLHISSTSYIWKGEDNSKLPIERGDKIHAWGQPQGSDILAIEKMWVNIINLRGLISRIREGSDSTSFQMVDSRQGVYVVSVDRATVVDQIDQPEVSYSRDAMPLRENQRLQLIGLELPGRTVRGTRVLVSR